MQHEKIYFNKDWYSELQEDEQNFYLVFQNPHNEHIIKGSQKILSKEEYFLINPNHDNGLSKNYIFGILNKKEYEN